MSLILNKLFLAGSIFRSNLTAKVISTKFIRSTSTNSNEVDVIEENGIKYPVLNVTKDRTKIIPAETSIQYLQSTAYKLTYGDYPVWKFYRRNFKGQFAPKKTRKMCIRGGVISTGNPCPICRDEYLVLDYRNVELLKQFISEYTGEILSYSYTGICQRSHNNLLAAIMKARDYGLLTYDVHYRYYDHSEWQN
nr:PREDICTED: 28S ribosomal protein S18b, mitochondrial [Megachile rotundata]